MKLRNKVKETKELSVGDVSPNPWNPNSMDFDTMCLLGYCMLKYGVVFPVLVFYNPDTGKHQIIDGFHRWKTISLLGDKTSRLLGRVCSHLKIKRSEVRVPGTLPCVVLDITIEEAMQLTVLMNRIKGAHMVSGMSSLVSDLTIGLNVPDVDVAQNLGMEGEEFIRLKAQKGERVVAEKFKNHSPSKSWEIA